MGIYGNNYKRYVLVSAYSNTIKSDPYMNTPKIMTPTQTFFIVERFGSSKIDEALLERMAKVTGKPVHHLLRRGLFFSHRYLSLMFLPTVLLNWFPEFQTHITMGHYPDFAV